MREILIVLSVLAAAPLVGCVSAEREESPSMGGDVVRRETVIEREKAPPTRVDVDVQRDEPPPPPPTDVDVHVNR